ncbi:MAG: site-specific integrase [Candidatus Odinarchaeota archaeon]|nr:site-specific integrase [Candidatus Odinarchaeota archaeon]
MEPKKEKLTEYPVLLKTTPLAKIAQEILEEKEGEKVKVITREQFEELRKHLRGELKIIAELLFFTAARISEFLNLQGKDIETAKYEGYEWIIFSIKTLKHKKRPIRKIPVIAEEMSKETREFLWKKMGKKEYLFSSPWSNRSHYTRQWAWKQIKRIDPSFYPHLFRHSRLTDIAIVVDLLELYAFAGWSIKNVSKTASHYIYLQWIHRAEKLLFKKEHFGYG